MIIDRNWDAKCKNIIKSLCILEFPWTRCDPVWVIYIYITAATLANTAYCLKDKHVASIIAIVRDGTTNSGASLCPCEEQKL